MLFCLTERNMAIRSRSRGDKTAKRMEDTKKRTGSSLSSLLADRMRRLFEQPTFNSGPIDILEERFDIFAAFRGLVVEQESVFPNIHYEDGNESGDVAFFVRGDPVVGQSLGHWVLE